MLSRMKYEIYKAVNHIPGIHDNGRPVTFDFNSVLESCFTHAYIRNTLREIREWFL